MHKAALGADINDTEVDEVLTNIDLEVDTLTVGKFSDVLLT